VSASTARAVDVLVPTRRRHAALAVTLAGLAAQPDVAELRVVVSDQTPAASTTGQTSRPGTAGRTSSRSCGVIERSGGVGVLPSGAWHAELPTQVTDRTVDAYAAVLEAADREVA
jgi:hypothetical protein